MKQILLYSAIYSFVAEQFIQQLSELQEDEDLTVRVNSPGGSVFASWGMIAAMQEHKGSVTVKVDGNAASMGFYLTLFADKVEALDVTKFLVHRADGYVQNEDDQKLLDSVNKDLRAKMEKRIDKTVFKEVTGVDFNEIFDSENRKDVWLTAKEAKKIGLVDKVVRLNPREIEAINTNLVAFSEVFSQGSEKEVQGSTQEGKTTKKEENFNNKKNKKMTITELKASHPELYAQVYGEGVNAEKERIGAWLAFKDIDMEAVQKGIEEGKEVTQKVMAEMTVKMTTSNAVKDVAAENVEEVKKPTEEKEQSAEEKELANAQAEALAAIGLTDKI